MERKPVTPPANGLYFTSVKKTRHDYIPSGSTLLDCVLGGGWPLGRMSNIVGDYSTGKTLICIEAASNFHATFPDGKIIYLEAEAAFDPQYAEALGMPVDRVEFLTEEDLPDFTIESWYDHLARTIAEITKEDVPCLYVVDSLDALSDRAEKEREIDKGSFGASKPKMIGQLFRRLTKDIEKTRLHLMIVSQVRDNIGVMFGDKHTRSGGKAMDFYASQVLWLAQLKKLEKTIRKQKRVYGIQVRARCKKNKVGLPFRECEFPLIFGYGIDDITSMLAWLEAVGAEEVIQAVIQEPYKTLPDLAERIKALPKSSRVDIVVQLSERVIELWEQIETTFIPKHAKY